MTNASSCYIYTEGYHRNYPKEYIQFLYIAKSSAWELQTLLQIAQRLRMIDADRNLFIENLLTEVLKMLSTLIFKLKEKHKISLTNPIP